MIHDKVNGSATRSDVAAFTLCALARTWPITLLALSLTLSAIVISPKKPYWNDELFTYYMVAAESFGAMWGAFNDKLNNTPFAYFGLGWLWTQLFGASPLSLRLFSSFAFSGAALALWIPLCRTFGFWGAAFGCLAVFATSSQILSQNAEARMYGLFMLGVALAVLLYDRFATKRPSIGWLVSIFALHVLIVHTHLFGLFYSGTIALALLVSDMVAAPCNPIRLLRDRAGIYIAIVAAWLSFLLYLPAFLVQADAGNPYSWMPTPVRSDLMRLLTQAQADFINPTVMILLIVLAGGAAVVTAASERTQSQSASPGPARHLICLALLLMSLPVVIWVMSRIGRPIFYPRYMLPSAIGWAILVAAVAFQVIPVPLKRGESRIAWLRTSVLSGTLVLLVTVPFLRALDYRPRVVPGTEDIPYMLGDLPIVVQSSGAFLERRYHSSTPDRYVFVLDFESADTEASGRFGMQQQKHMEAWARALPDEFGSSVVESEIFLREHDRFVVLAAVQYEAECSISVLGVRTVEENWEHLDCPQWLRRRLLPDPGWTVTELGEIWGQAFLLVERRGIAGPDPDA